MKSSFEFKKNLGGCDGNEGLRSEPEWVFEFLRYFIVIKFLNDPNGLVLDLILSKLFEI